MKNLLRRLARRFGPFLGIAAAVLVGFEFLICAVVSTVNVPALFGEILKNMPPLMKDVLERYIGGFGPADLLAFGWNHPIALALGAAAAIVLAARAVAGEIEAGTLELVLSQPISRTRYLGGQVVFGLAGLALLSAAGAFGSWLGQRAYALNALDLGRLALLALNFFLLQACWFALTLVASVFGREAGRVALTGFLIALLSYLVSVIGGMWPRAAFLLPYSPNAYYDPRIILGTHAVPARSAAVLGGLAVAGLAAALARFRKRDIP